MSRSVSPFDPRAADASAEPFENYRSVRSECPVYHLGEDEVVVMGYADADRVLRDANTFQVLRLGVGPDDDDAEVRAILARGYPFPLGILELDGPEHATQRALVAKAFTARRVNSLREPVQRIIDELCDQIVPGEEFEFREGFSFPMSSRVIAYLLGIDPSLMPTFKGWVDAVIQQTKGRVFDHADKVAWAEAVVAFQHYMAAEFDRRRVEPQDDLLTDLLTGYAVSGRGDRIEELLRQALVLLVAGTETTSNALTSGMWLLINNPDRLAEVLADRSLIPSLVEEVLRMESPLRLRANRIAVRDTEIGGVAVSKGSSVVVVIAAANRDEKKFACPEEFRPARTERGHLSFGIGPHFCVGAALARLELSIAFDTLLTRFGGFRAGPSQPDDVSRIEHAVFRAIENLYLTFDCDPAARM